MISVIVLYTLIPATASLLGASLGTLYHPKKRLLSALQHFVAGIVIAAVATELLPKVLQARFTVAIGFILGVIAMLALKAFEQRVKGLIWAGCIDLFIDGLLIAVSFLAGFKSGILIAISLSFCAFFLTLTVMSTVRSAHVFWLALMLPLGGLIGGSVISQLPSVILLETIAFGVAALLYLGVEELLNDAHKTEDSIWISSTFFLGFFLVFLIQ